MSDTIALVVVVLIFAGGYWCGYSARSYASYRRRTRDGWRRVQLSEPEGPPLHMRMR